MGLQLEKHPSFISRVGWGPAAADVHCQAAEKWCELNGLCGDTGSAQPSFVQHFEVQYCRLGGVWKIWKGLRGIFPELIPHSVGGKKIELYLVFAIIKHFFPLIFSFSSEVRGYLSCDNKKEPKKRKREI